MAALTTMTMMGMAGAATASAPGNNGTVKVAPYGDIDTIPENNPHVGCNFQIEWFGFDAGVVSTVTFEEQAPTTGVGMTVSGPSQVQLDGDPGNGAGQDDSIDATQPYTLSFTGAPHPQQGYHVKLTINTPESNGADVKHKVFWVEGCVPPTTPTTPSPSPEVQETQDTTVQTSPAPSPAPSAAPSAQVQGEQAQAENEAENQNENQNQNQNDTEVLGQQAYAGNQSEQAPAPAQAQQQQALPTTINAGAVDAAEPAKADGPPVLALMLGLLGSLLALLALDRRLASAPKRNQA